MYVSCEKPQEEPIHLSKDHTPMRVWLEELRKRLEENHDKYAEVLTKKNAKERTMTEKVTSPILVAQHFRATFCTKEWCMEHVNTPINEIVVMYLSAEKDIRPPTSTDVSVCEQYARASCHVFLFCF